MKKEYRFVLYIGLLSLFADMTYEGARSITGPYLATLHASGLIVGIVAGLGELIGYCLRIISGYVSDKTGKFWPIAIVGYFINLIAVPLLALTTHWPSAAVLIITERFGKAIRVPPKDVMLSFATKRMGRGWGFGIQGALGHIGSLIGPLAIACWLSADGSFKSSFAFLAIPAAVAFVALLRTRSLYPNPELFETASPEQQTVSTANFPKAFWLYLIAISCVACGYVDFALIAFHFQKAGIIPAAWIPAFYAVAMAVNGISCLLLGKLFDIKGIPVLLYGTGLVAFASPLVFLGNFAGALIGMVLWGMGMGMQMTIMRAQLANLIPTQLRGRGYGILNMAFGLFWFLGSALMGLMYDISIPLLVAFSLVIQLIAIPFFKRSGHVINSK